ncbi:MAG TPA: hypothetical protein VF712_15090 [Thermoleophilaceae bacterium]
MKWPADAAPARLLGSRAFAAIVLVALVALSYYERTRALNASYWIDEGISVGIAKHSLTEIPGVLRQDGSPPLYYLILNLWTGAFGTREVVTHDLSVVFALACIPAGYWAASVWSRGAGLAVATLAAFSPFLDIHALETRMYSLVALLGMLAAGAYVRGFVFRRARFVPVFAVLLALMLYTHNWSLFLALGAGLGILALAAVRRDLRLLRDGVLAGAGALVLYAPWIPSLLYQAKHTGAPWSARPSLSGLADVTDALIGPDYLVAIVVLTAGAGLVLAVARGKPEDRQAILALGLALVVGVAVAFVVAQVSRGWAARYFAVFVAPMFLLLGLGASRARVVGVAGLIAFAVISYNPVTPSPYFKSNAEAVANEVNPSLRAGDVVLSPQPEQVPLLRHYLVDELRYADSMGWVADPRVTDWRDGLDRLRAADQPAAIEPVLRGVGSRQRLVLIRPIVRGQFGWRAPWTRLVRIRSGQIQRALARDERFREVGTYRGRTLVRSRRVGVVATLYERRSRRETSPRGPVFRLSGY